MGRLVRVVLVLCLLLAQAPAAHAARWWGWLDELSGPGPFRPTSVGTVTLPVPWLGIDKDGSAMVLADDFDTRRVYVSFETAFWDNEETDNFSREVGISSYQFIAFVPFSAFTSDEKSPLAAFDAGVGFGWYNFHGDGVARKDASFTRMSIPFRLKITPSELAAGHLKSRRLRRFLGAFSYRFGVDSLPGTFDRRDFIGPANYRSKNNWLASYGITIDVLQLLPVR